MSEYRPVTTVEDLERLDHAQMLSGYHFGFAGGHELFNVTRSFWHGWRNGRVDGGWAQNDDAQRALARAMCGRAA